MSHAYTCLLTLVLWLILAVDSKILQPFTLIKKSEESPEPASTETEGVNFDEYPIIVPKRAALLLDRIMVALQKAVDEDNISNTRGYMPEALAIIVPKRAALLLDRIMVALQKAVDEDNISNTRGYMPEALAVIIPPSNPC
ncbi:uncharacterized protein LOC103505475 [Diaphorina citri]|uniref:Uncharacterized protein LOC103505475 n=1 Tax=Diaphorina citri TaxID=121845 RepID=A0A3Q0IK04_DIACI|nr:uncharacterized protein LOC103505475 [Diaphorina citri]